MIKIRNEMMKKCGGMAFMQNTELKMQNEIIEKRGGDTNKESYIIK
ncbi:MAG: hypothetical protein NT007_08960 [Candidatus Kapabacteria bacterium]|nr:hypothetical protein [Candidatus Kapabacteria bacterium]